MKDPKVYIQLSTAPDSMKAMLDRDSVLSSPAPLSEVAEMLYRAGFRRLAGDEHVWMFTNDRRDLVQLFLADDAEN